MKHREREYRGTKALAAEEEGQMKNKTLALITIRVMPVIWALRRKLGPFKNRTIGPQSWNFGVSTRMPLK